MYIQNKLKEKMKYGSDEEIAKDANIKYGLTMAPPPLSGSDIFTHA